MHFPVGSPPYFLLPPPCLFAGADLLGRVILNISAGEEEGRPGGAGLKFMPEKSRPLLISWHHSELPDRPGPGWGGSCPPGSLQLLGWGEKLRLEEYLSVLPAWELPSPLQAVM